MKGIAHFAIGIASASCIPAAVTAGTNGDPLYFILGGVFGLLPDTLDFKIIRFLYRHDIEIRPDPLAFNAEMVSEGIASAIQQAGDTGHPIRLKLSTVQLDDEHWQSYRVDIDVAAHKVSTVKGPIVDLGGNAVEHPQAPSSSTTSLPYEVGLEYFASTDISILDGPIFKLIPEANSKKVLMRFLPWHRTWTHSIVLAALFGLSGAAIWDIWAGAIIFLAYLMHILSDQLGFLGCNLWFPITRERKTGLMIMQSGDTAWNLGGVWLSCLICFWNLYSATSWTVQGFTVIRLLFYGAGLPALIYTVLRRRNWN